MTTNLQEQLAHGQAQTHKHLIYRTGTLSNNIVWHSGPSQILIQTYQHNKKLKTDLEVGIGKHWHVQNVFPLSRQNQDSLLHCPQLRKGVVVLVFLNSSDTNFVYVPAKNREQLT